jgi:hypothetical protein
LYPLNILSLPKAQNIMSVLKMHTLKLSVVYIFQLLYFNIYVLIFGNMKQYIIESYREKFLTSASLMQFAQRKLVITFTLICRCSFIVINHFIEIVIKKKQRNIIWHRFIFIFKPACFSNRYHETMDFITIYKKLILCLNYLTYLFLSRTTCTMKIIMITLYSIPPFYCETTHKEAT